MPGLTGVNAAGRRCWHRFDMISERSLLLAERAVPRYTSYPTAPHFANVVGPDDMRAWLAGLDPGASLSLYLHVPYCRSICH